MLEGELTFSLYYLSDTASDLLSCKNANGFTRARSLLETAVLSRNSSVDLFLFGLLDFEAEDLRFGKMRR